MTALTNTVIRLRNLVVAEIPLWIGVVIAAVNAAAVRSPQGYAAAALVASLRFVVSPAFEQAALKQKVVDPKLVEAIANALSARQVVAEAMNAPESALADPAPLS